MEIKKVIIPAAGWGTRFLPQTKALPKEMLPVLDKPVIQYVVEEAVASGIRDVIIITGWQKRAIEDHFDRSFELEKFLESKGKVKELEQIRKIAQLANFIYIRQKSRYYGNAMPVLMAEPAIGEQHFAVMWGDEFIRSDPPRLAQPSNLAAHGAYILPREIFGIIRKLRPGQTKEVWLTDAINQLIKSGYPVYGCEIKNGKYYDTGNKMEYLKTVVEFALSSPDFSEEFRKYLREKTS